MFFLKVTLNIYFFFWLSFLLLSDRFFLCEWKTLLCLLWSSGNSAWPCKEASQVLERWHHAMKRKKVKESPNWHHALLILLFPAFPCCPVAGRQGPWAWWAAVHLFRGSCSYLRGVWDMASPQLVYFGSVCCSSKIGIIRFFGKITVWPVFMHLSLAVIRDSLLVWVCLYLHRSTWQNGGVIVACWPVLI